ncbi:MAG: ATP-dependent protease ATPase subunit HslU [Abditibacteriota bacterium]|nr:ATP-dependent protease ATPase subunit HslU [Abditibacteriota bacterium]
MSNTTELTPRQVVAELDKYIIGQTKAKKSVAIALRNRYRRNLLSDDLKKEIIPKNILMIGPTGVGKTEIARRLAKLANAPFIKVEATKFTEVGYVGRDVDSMIRDLVRQAVAMVEKEKLATVMPAAEERALEKILDLLEPQSAAKKVREASSEAMVTLRRNISKLLSDGNLEDDDFDEEPKEAPEDTERKNRIRAKLREQLKQGFLDDREVEIEVEESTMSNMQFLGPGGDDSDMMGMIGGLMPKRKKNKRMKVSQARPILVDREAHAMLDMDAVRREARERAQQNGIIFIDEMDKVAGSEGGKGPDVSREGVQRDILPIIEGCTVNTRFGPVSTDHILFIAAGAFHVSKPSDLIPELQGRLPIRVELDNLTEDDFVRILTEPENALTKQYEALLAADDVKLTFTEDGIREMAKTAARINETNENIGARRLYTIAERILEEVSFEAPEIEDKNVTVDAEYVKSKLSDVAEDADLSRYIL